LKLPTKWREMSTSAAKVYTWLVVTGGRGGLVENDFAKIADANDLSVKVLRAALRELEDKAGIHVERATSRYGQTRINLNASLAGSLARNSKPFKPSPQGTIEAGVSNPTDDVKPSPQVSIEAGVKPSQAGSVNPSIVLEATDIEDLGNVEDRRREQHFRVLAVIAELLPSSGDVGGRAKGVLSKEGDRNPCRPGQRAGGSSRALLEPLAGAMHVPARKGTVEGKVLAQCR